MPGPYYFVTPTRPVRYSGNVKGARLWARMHIDVGRSVLRFGSSWRLIDEPSAEDIETADVAFIGGRIYAISDAQAASLQAAGYGHWVTDDTGVHLPEIDYSLYGVGEYGTGPYGD